MTAKKFEPSLAGGFCGYSRKLGPTGLLKWRGKPGRFLLGEDV